MRHKRSAGVLAASALLLTPVLANASLPSGPTAVPKPALPTSWPAVPVAERLQPYLAGLLAEGGTERLRVLVSAETTAAARAAAALAGLTVQQTWASTGIVVAVGLPAQVAAVVGQPGVTYVEGDQELTYQLSSAHDATRSTQALATYKAPDGSRVDGRGISVAVIDSGIDGSHPFFQQDGASKVVANLENVCSALTAPTDTCFVQEPVTNDTDTNSGGGHGTHVAGIVAGVETTTTSPRVEELRGAAPGAKLVGLSVGAALSIINANAAMQWVVDHQAQPCKPSTDQGGAPDPACPPIRVTNHSYGPAASTGGNTFDPNSATVRIQRMLVAKGVVPVWAAGNDGGDGTAAFTNPSAMDPTPGVLMVASYNDAGTGTRDGDLSTFSSRGNRAIVGSYPDLSAPGDLITSSCRPYLPVCATGLDPVDGPGLTDVGTFNTISGTSMATPYVAGVVAQLLQVDPTLTPGAVEDLLEDTAHQFGSGYVTDEPARNDDHTTSFDKGHGLVDVAAVLATQQGLPEPGAPLATCTAASPQVVDPEGDATQVVLVDTPLPTQPSLDVRSGTFSWDGSAVTAALQVTDLAAGPPAGAAGEFFRVYLSRAGDPEVFLTANRGAAATAFSLRQQDGVVQPVTGVFDEATSQVRISFTPADYAAVLAGRTLAGGDRITVGQVLAQRDGNGATLTADTAQGSCPYVVGATATPEPTPTPTETATPSPSASPTQTATPSPTPTATASPSPSPTKKGGKPSPSPSPSCTPKGNGKNCT